MTWALSPSWDHHPRTEGSCRYTRAHDSWWLWTLVVLDNLIPWQIREVTKKVGSLKHWNQGVRGASASQNCSTQHAKELPFYLPPSRTWVPTPVPTGRKQRQAWLHVVWHKGNGMGKRSSGTKSPLRSQTVGLTSVTFLGHPNQQTQASLPSRDPARATIGCPFLYGSSSFYLLTNGGAFSRLSPSPCCVSSSVKQVW